MPIFSLTLAVAPGVLSIRESETGGSSGCALSRANVKVWVSGRQARGNLRWWTDSRASGGRIRPASLFAG
jgi:hypothetical protein